MAEKEFRKGDDVTWSSHGQTVHGEVVEEITEDTEEAGRTVRASKARHLAQRPDGDVEHTRWRYSMMNWDTTPSRTDPPPVRWRCRSR